MAHHPSIVWWILVPITALAGRTRSACQITVVAAMLSVQTAPSPMRILRSGLQAPLAPRACSLCSVLLILARSITHATRRQRPVKPTTVAVALLSAAQMAKKMLWVSAALNLNHSDDTSTLAPAGQHFAGSAADTCEQNVVQLCPSLQHPLPVDLSLQ